MMLTHFIVCLECETHYFQLVSTLYNNNKHHSKSCNSPLIIDTDTESMRLC